ncbi:MAG TPA: FAD-binding oxidoreductase [Casimicrobiaceae bacterium]|nr:FAD-binding oxidoreductase [Casimicrobiaceae bacterium]
MLQRDLSADVAIVGGGYTGLSAAQALQRCGIEPAVLEAKAVGWGASGRNGGCAIGKFRVPFPAMARAHGLETARRMHDIAHESLDVLEELIADLGVPHAQFERSGNLRCAHTPRALDALIAEADWLRSELKDDACCVLSRAQLAEELGSDAFVGGVLNRLAGTLHPLNYVRGLAAGLVARKVQIFENSPATRIAREPRGVVVETPSGTVRARQVLIATDAYSDFTAATGKVSRRMIPFRTAIIATERMPEHLQAKLLTAGRGYSETRRMMKWFRKVDGRFVFGGRGAFGKEDTASSFEALRRAMTMLFPDLEGLAIEFRWSGLVGMTFNQLPQIGRIDDRTFVAFGYNGVGIAMATLLGQYAGRLMAGESPQLALLDASRQKTVPFYPLRTPGARIVAGWYQMLDALGR